MVAIAAAVVVAFIGGLYFITHHKKKSLRRFRPVKLPEMAFRRNLKSAGAISKSWKAASLAYVRQPNLLPVVKCRMRIS
jgi:hypothetical protein